MCLKCWQVECMEVCGIEGGVLNTNCWNGGLAGGGSLAIQRPDFPQGDPPGDLAVVHGGTDVVGVDDTADVEGSVLVLTSSPPGGGHGLGREVGVAGCR